MFYVLERYEGEFAVLIADDKSSVNILKSEISGNIGDVFVKGQDGKFVFDADQTKKRRESIVSRHRSLFNRAK
ncbi:MAG: DUF3006 domain-containing protein [Oscillospiraceae bacterium]|nr:DUF3006 domain-containing protein [Oscillospiraceae bacterium]